MSRETKLGNFGHHFSVVRFGADSANLSLSEAGAYAKIQCYYFLHGNLNVAEGVVYSICGAQSQDEKLVVDKVLGLFFYKTDCGFKNDRFELEIVNKTNEFSISIEGRLPSPTTPEIRSEVMRRDGYRCTYCQTDIGPFHVDHIHPRSRGGLSDLKNLCCACIPCNLSKSDKLLDEWAGR